MTQLKPDERLIRAGLTSIFFQLKAGRDGCPPHPGDAAALKIGGHVSRLIEMATDNRLTTVLVPLACRDEIIQLIHQVAMSHKPPDDPTLQ